MEILHRKTFYSWNEVGSVWDGKTRKYVPDEVRAVALCDGTWFFEAINAMRDGDMGEKDKNGVYSRTWAADDIYNADVTDVRPATLAEVKLYQQYCDINKEAEYEAAEIVAVIYGNDRTDVIFKSK